jgi:MFS transporter, Spinster family, sphingosine-1-phosphate transporter
MSERGYKNYLLGVLLLIFSFNYVDRMALGLLLQDIKVDLELSDTQLGLLTGMAFALFYSIMGIPIARWADRGNRTTIIALTTAVWSGAVALCGLAGNFTQLLLIRVGVAVGEAGCLPPAHSLIADYFSRAERPRAVARYMLGAPLSLLIGYLLAGWLNQLYGWRTTFVILALPGLFLSLLAWLTLKEPRVMAKTSAPGEKRELHKPLSAEPEPALLGSLVTLWANRTFRQLLICFSLMSLFGEGVSQWRPAFFIRSYRLDTAELGIWLALIYGLGGILGTYVGGVWASRYAANNEALQLRATAMAYAVFGLVSVCIYLSPNAYLALGLLGVAAFGANVILGPVFATIQTLVPDHMRATSIAILYLFANLIGLGLGPLAVGSLSDLLRTTLGEESLRYSLLAVCPGYGFVVWHLWRASTTVTQDIDRLQPERNARGKREGDLELELRSVLAGDASK